MNKYEYKIIQYKILKPTVKDFNKEGKEGWELMKEKTKYVTEHSTTGSLRTIVYEVLYKREIE